MEKYSMGQCCGRPYNRTCGMSGSQPVNHRASMPEKNRPSEHPASDCGCILEGIRRRNAEMLSHVQHLEPAMAYVPCQKFTENFELAYALQAGTIFPQLCKPFCGKRGACKS